MALKNLQAPDYIHELGFCDKIFDLAARRPEAYLAGKCSGGFRVGLPKKLPCINFLSSAGSKHSEHGSGRAYYAWGSEGYSDFIEDYFVEYLDDSDILVAYLDDATSYGSIAEIAWAAAKGKRCVVYLPREKSEVWHDNSVQVNPFWDAYWFVCALPNVDVRRINTIDDAVRDFQAHYIDCDGNCGGMTSDLMYALSRCQSPIEEWLCLALFGNDMSEHLYVQGCIGIDDFVTTPDFVFEDYYGGKIPNIAIYCDGYDYHSSQYALVRDRRIDRLLQQDGWTVLRFMGSELWNDLEGCVESIREYLELENDNE